MSPSIDKVGPFLFPVTPKGAFHVASHDQKRIDFLKSPALCNSCHDVRVPGVNVTAEEHNMNPGGEKVTYFRLENLSTEYQTGAYNSTDNPFGKVVRCQDCHMSSFPFSGNSTYQVGDMKITSPTPGIFPTDYAAVPGVSTEGDYALQKRPVVTHHFTGVDVPLVATATLSERLGANYPDPHAEGNDTHGIPNGLDNRRQELLKAAVRISLAKSDATASIDNPLMIRTEAVSLTGHRFPAGFSQERTAYVQLTVKDDNGFLVYQSGYQVDKSHPETGENQADGNLNDEDLEHTQAIVNPGRVVTPYQPGAANNGHTNELFETGPDSGPEARVYAGASEGLVLFRNELTHVFMPGENLGRKDANGQDIIVTRPHFEETFSASFANAVDNYRSLSPLVPRTYGYQIQLPSKEEQDALGIQIKGPLHVHAQVNFEHFPPLFLRFLARATGPNGPAGHDLQLLNEKTIDDFLKNIEGIAQDDFTIELEQPK